MKVFQQLRRRGAVPQVSCLTLGRKKQTLLQPVLGRMVHAVHPRPDILGLWVTGKTLDTGGNYGMDRLRVVAPGAPRDEEWYTQEGP